MRFGARPGLLVVLAWLLSAGSACSKEREQKPVDDDDDAVPRNEPDALTVEVDFVLVAGDHDHLACAMERSAAGLRCAYERPDVRAKGVDADPSRNRRLLQPVTTVDNQNLLVAGLWSQPALREHRAAPDRRRFHAKCNFAVRRTARAFHVQWKRGESWQPFSNWQVGVASDCTSKLPTEVLPAPVELDGRSSCAQARDFYVASRHRAAPGEPPDLTAGAFAAVLNKGTYLNACGVPPDHEVSVCVAVQNGRALGVTVTTKPSSVGLETCVDAAVRAIAFPSHPRMDVATTVFAAQ